MLTSAAALVDDTATTAPSALPFGLDLKSYATIIVAFSGGKDSLACVLYLLDLGVPRHKIELWHHRVDGFEGSTLMDWACTDDYCLKVATALGIRIYYSWKEGGFEREMLRDNARTAPIHFEEPLADGRIRLRQIGGTQEKYGTRLKFPQVSADLMTRWCSAYLKIDVGAAAIRNQKRFRGARTLVLTGERAQESAARAKYAAFECDRADDRRATAKSDPAEVRAGRDFGKKSRYGRHVDRWRAVLSWSEEQVWEIIERHRINPHPAYRLGWGRVSCMKCIFGSPAQWASVKELDPQGFEGIAQYEDRFGVTIHRKTGVRVRAVEQTVVTTTIVKGKAKRSRSLVVVQPYTMAEADKRAALSRTFNEPVILPEGTWKLPKGAFGESCGPT